MLRAEVTDVVKAGLLGLEAADEDCDELILLEEVDRRKVDVFVEETMLFVDDINFEVDLVAALDEVTDFEVLNGEPRRPNGLIDTNFEVDVESTLEEALCVAEELTTARVP